MKLELRHIAPYLPYGLKVLRPDGRTILPVTGLETSGDTFILQFKEGTGRWSYGGPEKTKPILRPLSDLTKEIEHNGERFVPVEVVYGNQEWKRQQDSVRIEEVVRGTAQWNTMRKLLEWHFDVFGLIESGLAVGINTIES